MELASPISMEWQHLAHLLFSGMIHSHVLNQGGKGVESPADNS
jgi:hypothetical protein